MKARELEILPCELAQVRQFVELNHYSHSVNGVKISYCFRVVFDGAIIGGVIFGALSTTAWKRFANSEEKVIELRRLVLLDEAGRNSESRVVGWCLRWLKKHAPAIEVVVSYADPAQGHSGVIYRASNFQYLGVSAEDKGFRDPETGKTYHSRALRTKYNGDFKPFVKKLRDKHEAGLLEVCKLPGKHCFIFPLKKLNQKALAKTGKFGKIKFTRVFNRKQPKPKYQNNMANNNALIAIAAAATALAAAATALVSGDNSCGNVAATPSTDDAPAQDEAPAPAKRRGRPPGGAAPAETKPEPEAEQKVGKTLEELRALIEPLVKGGQGDEVKKVIAKYAPKLSEIDPKDHAAFSKDIEALSM